ncbi:hypothetical protein CLV35_1001 [Motilibacter peucedani]|uniref:PIN domain-containing protein n=1 Tax=Motilibacter peucedani TaxID=598650 RepID=A0A420XUN4_9ACTN|nr:hypothetical protein [Motilibacter peucedani]RKS80563.1 hypothetical protein CLV35_1001 [Motilibacter peucedani]
MSATGVAVWAAKSVSAPAANSAVSFFKKKTISWQVSRRAVKACASDGIVLNRRQLQKWLRGAKMEKLVRDRNVAEYDEAVAAVGGMATMGGHRLADARQAAFLNVLYQWLSYIDEPQARRVRQQWEDIRHEALMQKIDEIQAEVGAPSRDGEYEHALERLPVYVQEIASRAARTRSMQRLVQELSGRPAYDRGPAATAWIAAPPDWLREGTSDVWLTLAAASAAYGQNVASARALLAAVDAGAAPVGEVKAKAGLRLIEHEEQEARQILVSLPDEPLARFVLAVHDGRSSDAELLAFQQWAPRTFEDAALKVVLLVRWYVQTDRNDAAISLALESAEMQRSTGLQIMISQLLVHRAVTRPTARPFDDPLRALDLAISARDSRREWGGNSVEATRIAVTAAIYAGDAERALKLALPGPEGEATSEEADATEVRGAAGLAAAVVQDLPRAKAIAFSLPEEQYERAHIEAVVADVERGVGTGDATFVAAWEKARALARTDDQELNCILALAMSGIESDVSNGFREKYPEAFVTIDHFIKANGSSTTLDELRANVLVDKAYAVSLATRLSQEEGGFLEAGNVLSEAFQHYKDPRLAFMSAQRFLAAGHPERALSEAESGLHGTAPQSASRREALEFILDVTATSGNWARAEEAAEELIRDGAKDADIGWALVAVRLRRANSEGAWRALRSYGEALVPRTPLEANMWSRLHLQFAPETKDLVTKILAWVKKWQKEDEEFAGRTLALLVLERPRVGKQPELTDEESANLKASFAEFFAEYPDSSVLWTGTVNPEDPLATFDDINKALYERMRDVAQHVDTGAMPLGLLAAARGCSYTEIVVTHGTRHLRIRNIANQVDRQLIRPESGARYVLDATTLYALSLLPQKVRDAILALTGLPVVIDRLYADLVQGRDLLSVQARLGTQWDPESEKTLFHEIPEKEVSRRTEAAQSMVTLAERCIRMSWSKVKTLAHLTEPELGPWALSADVSLSERWTFWCDDGALRAMTHLEGGDTVSTYDLLQLVRGTGRIDEQSYNQALALLVGAYYIDLPASLTSLVLAAEADAWRPEGAAYALSRPEAWQGETVGRDLLALAGRRAALGEVQLLRYWVQFASSGLVRASGTPHEANSRVQRLLAALITENWMHAKAFKYTLEGLRASSREFGLPDPYLPVLRATHAVWLRSTKEEQAVLKILGLVGELDQADRVVATEMLLMR